jgi:hypothetical protein
MLAFFEALWTKVVCQRIKSLQISESQTALEGLPADLGKLRHSTTFAR